MLLLKTNYLIIDFFIITIKIAPPMPKHICISSGGLAKYYFSQELSKCSNPANCQYTHLEIQIKIIILIEIHYKVNWQLFALTNF